DCVDAAERKRILSRYSDHSRRFDAAAARRGASAEVILFPALVRELEQEPTAREIEILQLVAEGLTTVRSASASSSPRRRSSPTSAASWQSCGQGRAPTPSRSASSAGC